MGVTLIKRGIMKLAKAFLTVAVAVVSMIASISAQLVSAPLRARVNNMNIVLSQSSTTKNRDDVPKGQSSNLRSADITARGLQLVHSMSMSMMNVEGGQFLAVDGFEANDFCFKLIGLAQHLLHLLIGWDWQRELGECFTSEMLDASA